MRAQAKVQFVNRWITSTTAVLMLVVGLLHAETSEHVPYLSAEDELKTIELQDGYYLELVLSDPDVVEPVVVEFDGNGRMYVAEMRTYMQDVDGGGQMEPVSRVTMHEDSNGDGNYDKHTVFADKLLLPRIILALDDRIIIGETNTLDLYSYRDTNGDGVADEKEVWYRGGKRGGNLEHQPSGMIWSMDNWIYSTYNAHRLRFTNGIVEKQKIPVNRGQWGLSQDDEGMPWFVNAGGEIGPDSFQFPITYGRYKAKGELLGEYKSVWPIDNIPDVQGGARRLRQDNTLNHFTSTCGQVIYRGDRLPADLRGDLLFSEPVGRLVRRSEVTQKDGMRFLKNVYEDEKQEFIRSTDGNFRVVNMHNAPDGSLYLVDMYRGIIQEGNWVNPGSYLRKVVQEYELDKNFGRGRIWRLRHRDHPLDKTMPKMLNQSAGELVQYLTHPNGWWRDMAQKLIILKADVTLKGELQQLALTGKSAHGRLHALWSLEGLGLMEMDLLQELAADTDPKVRKAILRVAEGIYSSNKEAVASLVLKSLEDSDPNVCIQAMLSAKLLGLPSRHGDLENILSARKEAGVVSVATFLQKAAKPKKQMGRVYKPKELVLINKGKSIYQSLCAECHGSEGQGRPAGDILLAPALARSPRVLGDEELVTRILLHGLTGPIDGETYAGGLMVPMGSNDDQWLASVLSYCRTQLGNNADPISVATVKRIRQASKDQKKPWTMEQLQHRYPVSLGNRNHWKISASHHSTSSHNAVDGLLARRYHSKQGQEAGMWLAVELPEIQNISGIFLDSAGFKKDYPRNFQLEVSVDGKQWRLIKSAIKGTGAQTRVNFTEAVEARFVRVVLTSNHASFWSVADLQLLGTPLNKE